jgi:hypothetical protein
MHFRVRRHSSQAGRRDYSGCPRNRIAAVLAGWKWLRLGELKFGLRAASDQVDLGKAQVLTEAGSPPKNSGRRLPKTAGIPLTGRYY